MKFETTHMAGGYIRFDIPYLKLLPIKLPDEKQTNKINELVDKLLSLNNQLLEIGNKDKYKRENKEKESNDVDKQINQEVYKLYGITKDEQAIIEKSLESAKK